MQYLSLMAVSSDINVEKNREKLRTYAIMHNLRFDKKESPVPKLQVALLCDKSVPVNAAVLIDHRSCHVTVYAAGANEVGGFGGKEWLTVLLICLEKKDLAFKYRYTIHNLADKMVPPTLQACFMFYRICHFMGHPPEATIYNTDTFRSYAMHLSQQLASMSAYPKVEVE